MSSGVSTKLPNYGFEAPDTVFDEELRSKFNQEYIKIVEHRQHRWNSEDYAKKPHSRTMKRFVRKGVPPEIRAQYWMAVTGMDKEMEAKPDYFAQLLASDIPKHVVNIIDTDVPRTFPENKYFASNGRTGEHVLNAELRNVLLALAADMPEIGYCQGLNFVAAVILLVVNDAQKSFWLLRHLIKDVVPSGYYKPSMRELKRDCDVLSKLVKKKLPNLSTRLEDQSISFVVICTKWFICLFCDTLPFETSLRILDCLFYEGDKVLFRVGLTLMNINAHDLEKNCLTFPQLLTTIQKMVQEEKTLFCHQFMQQVFSSKSSLSRKQIKKLRMQWEKENASEEPNSG